MRSKLVYDWLAVPTGISSSRTFKNVGKIKKYNFKNNLSWRAGDLVMAVWERGMAELISSRARG